MDVVFNPEFLTEANAVEDFNNATRIVLGGPRPSTTKLKTIYRKVFPKANIVKTGSTHAEMVKYVTNTFLATKVSYANEIYKISSALGLDYDKVIEYATLDDRLGKTHWAVPGPDGDFGYGGHCFPKDLQAIVHLAENLDIDCDVLNATIDTNDKVRLNRDWEQMKGRAVT
jgi:UDPglucose 6-dehydrogenase